jgi:carotenoid cleavage dioxygenase
MNVHVVARYPSNLPADDDHPYRTGPWRPQHTEYDATDLDVVGDLPDDLDGVYLRNTENPLHDSLGRYHPFDGDGMIHAVSFANGTVEYRNRFVPTEGFEAERAAGEALWAGIMEHPDRSTREGWGARTRLKDASSTDVVVHAGEALSTHYQCGEAYRLDPRTLAPLGRATWGGRFPSDWGISAHPKIDGHTGELLFFNYAKQPPFMHYGVVDAANELRNYIPIELPGPRLPHDMAFTERYAILNDCPMFWDPDLLPRGLHAVRFFPELPTRFAVVPRMGSADDIQWFEASPTFVLHWINAYEDGDEIVIDGFHQTHPVPDRRPDDDAFAALYRFLDSNRMETRPHRWRLDLRTGQVKEEFLHDDLMEFGTIDPRRAGRTYRYSYGVESPPGWFLFDALVKLDVETGARQTLRCPEGVYISEAPFAPRPGGTAEDDGYLLTFTTDVVNDRSECWVLDAADITAGPLARIGLPERICVGTHAHWASATALCR